MRVLYVDDDRINLLLFEEACRVAGGVEVECADSGAEALELAPQWAPELLIVDLHLPDTDGYRLLPALRECLGQPTLPAYLCTADDAQCVAGPAQAAGYTGCWTKPVALAQILAVLDQYRADGTATP